YSQAAVRPLISLLDRYKFTVAENTPLEQEVALDPELLGHVFENLLAAYNPETGAVARKTTGSFYTPRSVVDFMVDESLVTYLGSRLEEKCPGCSDAEPRLRRLLAYTDASHNFSPEDVSTLVEAINEVRILDPACGSGAFPLGVLHKLVSLLQKLDPGNAAWKARQVANADRLEVGRDAAFAAIEEAFSRDQGDYARKLYLIENCLYGVDIQPIAVQIAKLRCFVSLVVEQEPDDTLPNRGILPLPNLETNFVAANTLLGLQRLGQLALRDRAIDEKEEELRRVRRRHFLAKRWPQKKELRARDKELRQELATLLETSQTLSGPEAKCLAGWDPYHADLWADFFDTEWMFSLRRGFDIVLGNPPYVRQEEIKELKPRFKGDYFCYTGTADLYVYFFEKAFDLLRPGGVLCFISSNKYFRSGYGEKLRQFLAENGDVRLLIDFGDAPVFSAIAYPSIVLVRKTRETREKAKLRSKKPAPPRTPSAASHVKVLRWEPGPTIEEFPEVFRDKSFELPQRELTPAGWRLERPIKLALLEKLRGAGTPLGEYVGGKFYYGVKTGLNEAFVVDRATRDRLIAEHPSSAAVLKPYLRGREIKRWQILSQDLWLIFIPWHFPMQDDPVIQGASVAAEEEFKKKYPAVFNHLSKFRPSLASRAEAETGIRYEWYALQRWRPEYWKEFGRTKIVYPDIYERQSFAWDDSGYFLANTCYFVPTTEQWLMGLFNSLVVEWFYGLISNRVRGGYLRAFTDYMKQVPIPKIGKAAQKDIKSEVRTILDAKRKDPGAPVGDLEARIEGTVAHLYGLTEDEFSSILSDLDLPDPVRLGALNAYRETAKELGR
ncbi:MAG: TaqI-like C-terminal specificity domain-containing protein, partial [Desulfuromonadales bacterium]|nr:TaqI-like C-terminal specificity domain-containing protein [Desulfuromonadales bacterium]